MRESLSRAKYPPRVYIYTRYRARDTRRGRADAHEENQARVSSDCCLLPLFFRLSLFAGASRKALEIAGTQFLMVVDVFSLSFSFSSEDESFSTFVSLILCACSRLVVVRVKIGFSHVIDAVGGWAFF